jgi:hypothetical protein
LAIDNCGEVIYDFGAEYQPQITPINPDFCPARMPREEFFKKTINIGVPRNDIVV